MYIGYAEFSHPSWLALACRPITAGRHIAIPAHPEVYRWRLQTNRTKNTVF
jgi:hypothetical protein